MDKFTDVLVSLEKEGYDFSVFVKERNLDTGDRSVKFSYAYVTPAAEQILPMSVWELVEEESIIKTERVTGIESQTSTMLSLNKRKCVEKYLDAAFKYLRQVPCKSIVKVWIKVIEPKKKTKYPYIKGELTKPLWWPREVQHKEPDHLQKEDRLRLMSSIILEVLPRLKDLEILDELCQATLALCLFKSEPHKEFVVKSIFDISRALCRDPDAQSVSVMDLASLRAKQKMAQTRSFKKAANGGTDSGSCFGQLLKQTRPESEASPTESLSTPSLVDMLIRNDPGLLDLLDCSRGEGTIELERHTGTNRHGEIF